MNTDWCVYIHTLPKEISGKAVDMHYVGITGKKPQERWDSGWGYRQSPHFLRVIKKYGWNNLKHDIVFDKLTKEQACNIEKILIATLKSNNHKYGFNCTAGGEGTNGMKHSEDTKRKMSENRTGSKNSFYGKKHSEYTRKLISVHHADFHGIKSGNSKAIEQYTLDGSFVARYECITDAERATGALHQNICHCANGKIKSSGGYKWCYPQTEVV